MKWQLTAPAFGDIVRVMLGRVYHYGIYLSEDEVIAFGMPPVNGLPADGKDVRVVATDVHTFLCGNFLETGKPSFAERLQRRPRKEIAARARASLGEGGYDILRNNCEHFAYACAFGKKKSAQVDEVRAQWRALPRTEVYVAPIPEEVSAEPLFPPERQSEVNGCANAQLRRQKIFVWQLLAFALRHAFGIELRDTQPRRSESGKWECPQCCFSLSHTARYAAVAVSRAPVGVDIEEDGANGAAAAFAKVATAREKAAYPSPSPQDFLKVWTAKESLFKREGGKAFRPAETETTGADVLCCRLPREGLTLSVAAQSAREALLHTVRADLSSSEKAEAEIL